MVTKTTRELAEEDFLTPRPSGKARAWKIVQTDGVRQALPQPGREKANLVAKHAACGRSLRRQIRSHSLTSSGMPNRVGSIPPLIENV